MLPTIEQICDDLKAGSITLQQAIFWLEEHRRIQLNDAIRALKEKE